MIKMWILFRGIVILDPNLMFFFQHGDDNGSGVTGGSVVAETEGGAKADGSRKMSSAASPGEAREDGVTSQVLHNVENVSHKAMEGAKSLGSFLFSVANKAGKTVTETATKVKTAVEENVSIHKHYFLRLFRLRKRVSKQIACNSILIV